MKNNLFQRVWDSEYQTNTHIYEIVNGNDPRVFALIEPGRSLPKNDSLVNLQPIMGVEGFLHPLKCINEYGYKPIEEIAQADFLTECKVFPIGR